MLADALERPRDYREREDRTVVASVADRCGLFITRASSSSDSGLLSRGPPHTPFFIPGTWVALTTLHQPLDVSHSMGHRLA